MKIKRSQLKKLISEACGIDSTSSDLNEVWMAQGQCFGGMKSLAETPFITQDEYPTAGDERSRVDSSPDFIPTTDPSKVMQALDLVGELLNKVGSDFNLGKHELMTDLNAIHIALGATKPKSPSSSSYVPKSKGWKDRHGGVDRLGEAKLRAMVKDVLTETVKDKRR
tara:strand:+ start:585 stop:1085 length:501 start_codon:yes stop_codon:yes gene_type:complete